MNKKKVSNQDISLGQTQGEDQKDQGDPNPILNSMLNQIGKKSSKKLNPLAKKNSSQNMSAQDLPDPSRKQSKKSLKGPDKNKI